MLKQTVIFNMFLIQQLLKFVHFWWFYLTYLTYLVHLLQLLDFILAYHSILIFVVKRFGSVTSRMVWRLRGVRRIQLVLRTQLIGTVMLVPRKVLLLYVQDLYLFARTSQSIIQFFDFLHFQAEGIFVVIHQACFFLLPTQAFLLQLLNPNQ